MGKPKRTPKGFSKIRSFTTVSVSSALELYTVRMTPPRPIQLIPFTVLMFQGA